MFKNLAQLRVELANRLKNTKIGNDRLTTWLNDAQDIITNMMDPDHLMVNTTFTTVADQRKYYLDLEFNKIISIVNEDANIQLDQISEGDLEDIDPDRTTSGQPYLFSVFGLEWIKAQLDVPSTITIVSTKSADTTQKVRINGIVDGVDDTELLTLNGTTPVTGSKVFTEIFNVPKNGITSGKVIVSAGATIIAELASFELAHQYQPVHLYPMPSGAESHRVRGIRRPRPMVYDEQFPDFPVGYHELVLIAATVRGNIDLFRPKIARDIEVNELFPAVDDLKKQMGNKRYKQSPVIQGVPFQMYWRGGRLPQNYGY